MSTFPNPVHSSGHRVAAVLTLLLLGAVLARPDLASAQTAVPTVTPTPALVRVAVSPRAPTRKVGEFQNFLVTGFFSDGSQKNFTQKVIYSSSNLGAVYPPNEQGNAGRVEAVGVGTAVISVTEPGTGVNSNATDDSAVMEVVLAPTPTPTSTAPTPTRTVTPKPTATATPVLVTLLITPLEAKRNVGQPQNFTVKGVYSNGDEKNLTQAVTYHSSNTSVVQTPNDTSGNKGTTLAVGAGVATISATLDGVTTTATGGDATFTVVVSPTPTATRTGPTPSATLTASPTATATPVLVSIALSPPSTKKGLGAFQNFVATGTFSDGSTKNFTQQVTYSSSDPTIASAPNDPAHKSRVTAVNVGTAIISAVDPDTDIGTAASGGNATFEVFLAPTPTPTNTGKTPTRTVTPSPTPTATPRLIGLTISPTDVKKAVGQVQNFIVNATYSNGEVKNVTQKVLYISSQPSVAATGTDPNSKSKVLAVAPGVAIISAKDPDTGIATVLAESATFTVTMAPTPTPSRTGPTSTGPTRTPTLTASPTPSPTPVLVKIQLEPKTKQRGIGTAQNYTATGTFSDNQTRNLTSLLEYASSDPTIASAPNEAGNPGRILPLAVGVVTISATDPATGVSSSDSGGDATLTVVQASSPRPGATATPGLPEQTGKATTACQRDVRHAARAFVDKKLKALEKCGSAASICVQRKPDDPKCIPAVRARCATELGKLGAARARMIAAVIKHCAGLTSSEVLGADGLDYGEIANSCATRFGRDLSDLTSVAQCLAAQHACRAETLFALERPRTGELFDLVQAPPDASGCRDDSGGGALGLGLGDPKGVGKQVDRCVQALVRGGTGLARTRLAAIGRCLDNVFGCVEAASGNAVCLGKATQKCEREFGRTQREIGKLTVAVSKRCSTIDFDVLRGPLGANLDAVTPVCASYGIPTVASTGDYVACLIRQHECEVAELLHFESPRAEAMLDQIGRSLADGSCPEP
jgi:hypothetical protein